MYLVQETARRGGGVDLCVLTHYMQTHAYKQAWDTEKLDKAVEADSEAFQTREDKTRRGRQATDKEGDQNNRRGRKEDLGTFPKCD